MSPNNLKPETLCLHAGQTPDPTTMSRAVPVYRTSSYQFRNTEHAANLFALKELGNIYTRVMNPTHDVLEQRMAALEGGAAALVTSSGTSAIFNTIITLCQTGDEIVSASNLYGGTFTMFHDIFKQFQIKVNFVDSRDPKNFEKAITPKTKLIFGETIGNPALDVLDIQAVGEIAHKHGLPLVLDSTFTPPTMLRPLDHGADIVVHSLTKWIGGHGVGIGGVIVDSGKFDWKSGKFPLLTEPEPSYHGVRFAYDLGDLSPLAFILRARVVPLRNLGACLTPDNAWMFLQGVETLALRMERHSQNARRVAEYLSTNSKVEWTRYPGLETDPTYPIAQKYLKKGFGGMVVFGIKGGKEAGAKFINSLQLTSHLANVGDAKTLAIHPATTTHSQLDEEAQKDCGITPELVRLSIGIEHIDDIINDIEQALTVATA